MHFLTSLEWERREEEGVSSQASSPYQNCIHPKTFFLSWVKNHAMPTTTPSPAPFPNQSFFTCINSVLCICLVISIF